MTARPARATVIGAVELHDSATTCARRTSVGSATVAHIGGGGDAADARGHREDQDG